MKITRPPARSKRLPTAGPMIARFLIFFLGLTTVAFDNPAPPPVNQAAAVHQTELIEGWRVWVNGRLFADDKAATEKAIELLRAQLQEIVRRVPAPAVAKLREVTLWFSPEYPGVKPRAEYHPDTGWLRDHGRDPMMAKGVEFTDVRNFEAETKRMPNFTLHELAHAYHDRVLPRGFDNPEIKAAYERAKNRKSYDKVERWFGNGRPNTRERSYAMTNPMEYFAESTEAFFSRNDFFPFTRDELKQHDPEMWSLLVKLWGVPLIAGATPPRDRSVVSDDDRKWWAFQPLAQVRPPVGAKHPVDAFLLEAAKSKGLAMNPPASPATLLRRASLDLTGLPPTPEEVEGATQNSPFQMQNLIDRLLASTAYGERWARYWLDVARFAESSGFEHDYDRTNAFHYRDFVIRALNADLPFDQFARWQLAGDEFAPGDAEAMMATGFLGAGVFPTQITANEVERTRYDALDDMLSTAGNAFLGLTLGCARCHDHKFDPIPTEDYYRLLSTFTTVVRSEVELDLDPAASAKALAAHEAETAQLTDGLAAFERGELREKFNAWLAQDATLPESAWNLVEVETITSKAGANFEKLDDGSWLAKGKNGASDVYTITATTPLRGVTRLKLEALTHESAPHQGPGRADNGNFALSRIRMTTQPRRGGEAREVKLVSPQATHEQNKLGLSVAGSLDDDAKTGWAVDGGGIGKDQAAAFVLAEPVDFEGGVKLVVTLEFGVNTGHNLVRPRLSVNAGGAPDLLATALPAAVAALAPKLGTLTSAERDVLFDWWKTNERGWRERHGRLAQHRKNTPKTKTPVMVCVEGYQPIVMHSQGAPFFEQTHLLRRGDPNQKQSVAAQGFLQVLMRGADEKRWQWTAPPGAPYSGRRRSLANWLTDTEHGAGALMARVQVNRVWQHHFGRGLVATPNDFGRTGAPPSHPALLDWLAGEFIRGGWRLKPLHRLIMTSAAYGQRSERSNGVMESWSDGRTGRTPHPNTPALHHSNPSSPTDPDNALFLRREPQRLESEAVRDSMLAVAGVLDRTMFGAGTLQEESRRRSIYFTVKRSRLMNSMVVFDAPEPLTSQGTRPTTTVAPQALLIMNSPQVRSWAGSFARRVEFEAKTDETTPFVARAYLLALARPPRPSEAQEAAAFISAGIDAYTQAGKQNARTLALIDFCQAVLALNEFVYVD